MELSSHTDRVSTPLPGQDASSPRRSASLSSSGGGSSVQSFSSSEIAAYESDLSATNSKGIEPQRGCLQRCAQTCLGRALSGAAFKAIAGSLISIGLGTDVFGESAQIVACVGAGLWFASTVLSTSDRSGGDGITKHLAESVGYGLAGCILLPASALVSCICCEPKNDNRQRLLPQRVALPRD